MVFHNDSVSNLASNLKRLSLLNADRAMMAKRIFHKKNHKNGSKTSGLYIQRSGGRRPSKEKD
jgi:hypothetical protein